ncbi:SMI1/KNR4 family protein [Streptomyces sp. bgisy082]|uniref:SMI1/KNR4 family protein n=1 Tax=Streptomyces sp. bgisy082 TaxID=3413776 RepID=UPI003D726ED9
MSDHRRAVAALLGEPRDVFAGHCAWRGIEEDLGVPLPQDYKQLVDAYAPVRINGHLYLEHPANEFYRLGQWISETLDDVESEGLGRNDAGEASGLIPLACTDRGEYVFAAPGNDGERWRVLSRSRDEPEFYEHRMSFSEWLCKYLEGGEMFGPGHAVPPNGPVRMESLPTAAGERISEWYGPERPGKRSGGI